MCHLHLFSSWGTPVNNQYYNHNEEETDYQVCMENVDERFSSHRQKPNGIPDLDLQLSHSGNEQFRKVMVWAIVSIFEIMIL